MKTLYDSIDDKEHFKEVIYKAVEHAFLQLTPAERYQVVTDWRNNQPPANEE